MGNISGGERPMYRPSDPQKPLFDAGGLLPPDKRERCEKSWAGAFRRQALPILRRVEDEFAELFDPEEGRPNRPVELVLGTLILKEMSDLTDEEALAALEFDARWWYALSREPHEMHLCQKTLHNFRAGLMKHDKSKVAFRTVTDELIRALGIDVGRQRLDSTHILSNIAVRNRLGLMCDVIGRFLRAVRREDPKAYEELPKKVLERHGEESRYGDARRGEGPRRLGVVARDVWRLVDRFEDHAGLGKTEEWKLLNRILKEQCDLTLETEEPKQDDDDHGEGGACVVVKEGKDVGSDSLQSAHDAGVTYSGKKGKGYEVQVAETCTEGNAAQLITEVQVTPSCQSDQKATVPVVERLEEAGAKPKELVADTAYSGGENAAALAAKGVSLLAPAAPTGKPIEGQTYPAPSPACPTEEKQAVEWLREQEASPEFEKRYAIRAGIESTNAELKGKHGLRRLRVRGKARVKLAVYFKALACNVKRALRVWLLREREARGAALA
jgi:IS5 family transposase